MKNTKIGILAYLIGVFLFMPACDNGNMDRTPLLPSLYFALLNYAKDHDGWFPKSNIDSYDAIQKLYPEYCPTGKELAGLSGNIDAVVGALAQNKSISNLTSWVYIMGLKDSDSRNIAIIWESKFGLFEKGKNIEVRPVLLLNGVVTNISKAEWKTFEDQQKQLRDRASQGRLLPE